MKKTKNILAVMMSLLIAFSALSAVCVPASAEKAESGTCGDNLTWTLDEEGTLTISGTGKVTDFGWYSLRKSITKVVIETGVTSIGDCAFYECTSLASIIIPGSVTNIGRSAFSDCTSLTGITVEDSNVKYCDVDGVLFNKDETILICYPAGKTETSYIIPNSVTKVDDSAFYVCRSLTSITIPDSVTSIGDSAFYECTSLTSINIPDSIASIADDAFSICTSLTNITIPDSVTSIGGYAFCGCKSLTSITIPDSVTSIGCGAFYRCISLASITIPDSVTNIGWSAFSNCTSLTGITVEDSNVKYCDVDGVLFNKDETILICYPAGKTETSYIIPNSVTKVDDSAFYVCRSLTSITIPDSVTSIGDCAFYECTSLTSINIPDSIASIADLAFYRCTSLTSINIPDSITSIGDWTFEDCTSLTGIAVEDSNVKYCDINGVLFNKDITILICYPLGKAETSYIIPNSVTKIDDSAFSSCTSIKSITIPDSVTGIDDDAFYGCTSLKDVYYSGSETDKDNITIGTGNAYLENATWHCKDEEPHNIFMNSVVNVPGTQTVDYGTKTTITATATGIPEDYSLAVYVNGRQVAKGSNTEVSYDAGEVKSNISYAVKIVDAQGNVQNDASGSPIVKDGQIKCSSGFLAKLIAFFRSLFGLTPTATIRP